MLARSPHCGIAEDEAGSLRIRTRGFLLPVAVIAANCASAGCGLGTAGTRLIGDQLVGVLERLLRERVAVRR